MDKFNDTISELFADGSRLLEEFRADESAQSALREATKLVASVLENGGKVLSAGNGGSLADAMHFAEELTGRFHRDRRPLAAMALADPTHLTCVSNDFGFDHVFSRMVEGLAKPEDAVLLLSTSGNSNNLVMAAESAKKVGAKVIGFLGRGGGALGPHCDVMVLAPGKTSDRIQEIHMMSLHILIQAVEAKLGVG